MENNYCFDRYDKDKDLVESLIDKPFNYLAKGLEKARDLTDLSLFELERFAAILNDLKCQSCDSTDVTVTLNRIDGKFKGVLHCRKCGEIIEISPCTITKYTAEYADFSFERKLIGHNTFSWYGQYK